MKIPFPQIQGTLDSGAVSTVDTALWPQTPKVVTANGSATQLIAKFNQTAGFFNTTSDYVVVPASVDFNFPGDFTIELWFMRGTSNNFPLIKCTSTQDWNTSSTGDYLLSVGGDNGVYCYIKGASNTSGGSVTADNTWHHLAMVRTGSTVKHYLDGVVGVGAFTSSIQAGNTQAIEINRPYANMTPNSVNGWIKEVRISNVARYTTNFTPSTSQFTTDGNTKLLMHFDSPATSPLSPVIAFDGTGDYLKLDDHADWDTGSNPFTLEMWVCPRVLGTIQILATRNATFNCGIDTGNTVYFNNDNVNWNIASTQTLSLNAWYHLAFVSTGTAQYIFINGKQDGTIGAFSGSVTATANPVYIGCSSGQTQLFTGSMREIRFSTVARYTSAFTPSQNGFVVDSNTKLYIKGNENNGTPSDYVPTMTSNVAPTGAIISASGEQAGGAWTAFDGDTSAANGWAASNAGTRWLQVQFPSARQVFAYSIQMGTGLSYPISDWTLQGSADGSSWTTVDTRTAQTGLTTKRVFTLSSPQTYAYWRINDTLSSLAYSQIGEMELLSGLIDSETTPKIITIFGDTKVKYTEDFRSCVFKDDSQLITNGSFEEGDPPTAWTLFGSGATFSRSSEQVKVGSYSGKVTRNGTDCYIATTLSVTGNYANKTVTLGAWVWSSVANRCVINLNDGVGSTSSSYHTGSSTWEYLEVTRVCSPSATSLFAYCYVANGDTSAYFDGVEITSLYGRHNPYPLGSAKVDFIVPFGTGVAYIPTGANGLSTPDSPDFYPTGDVTWEAYVRYDMSSSTNIVGQSQDGLNGVYFYTENTTPALVFRLYVANSGPLSEIASATVPMVKYAWMHCAFQKRGAYYNFFFNGTKYGGDIAVSRTWVDFTGNFWIGADAGQTWGSGATKLLDNVRVSKNVARYGTLTSFNPPGMFTSDGSTALLANMDGTGSSFVDSSPIVVTPPTQDTLLAQWSRQQTKMKQSAIAGSLVANPIGSTYSLIYTSSVSYGGVLDAQGNINFTPTSGLWANKVSPYGVVSTYATLAVGYAGGALAPNGDIHFGAYTCSVGQKVSANGVVSTYPLIYTNASGAGFGAVCALNGDIHFPPLYAPVGQKVSSVTGIVSTYSLVHTISSATHFGGVLAPNGDIHFTPFSSIVGQKVSASGVVSTYSLVYTGQGISTGGVLDLNGEIHFCPWNSSVGQKVNTLTGVVSTYSLIVTTFNSYYGAVLAPNGDVHFVPFGATVGQKVSMSGVVSTYSLVWSTASAFTGGILDLNGNIHFCPNASINQGVTMKIATTPAMPFSKAITLSPSFNRTF